MISILFVIASKNSNFILVYYRVCYCFCFVFSLMVVVTVVVVVISLFIKQYLLYTFRATLAF